MASYVCTKIIVDVHTERHSDNLWHISSGSRILRGGGVGRGGGDARNMKYNVLQSVTIFLGLFFTDRRGRAS